VAIAFQAYENESSVEGIYITAGTTDSGSQIMAETSYSTGATLVPIAGELIQDGSMVYVTVKAQNKFNRNFTQKCELVSESGQPSVFDKTPPLVTALDVRRLA
jgi:hypothetical protein